MSKYRDLVDEAWAERIKRLPDAELKAEADALIGEVEGVRAKYGGSIDTAKGADARRVKEICGMLGVITDVKSTPSTGYEPQPTPGAVGLGGFGSPSFGGQMTDTPGWKSGHWSGPILKSLGMAGGTKDLAPAGAVTVPSLTAGIVPIDDRPARLLEVIPRGGTLEGTDQYAYLKETKREHKAAETAPGALKPTSVYNVEKVEETAKTIAHLSQPVQRQDLEDAALLRQYVDQSLRQGVTLRLDEQILSGDGEGQNLTGLNNTEEIEDVSFATDILTTARKALTALEDNEIPGGVYVLDTEEWESLELATAEGSGEHVLSNGRRVLPVDRARRLLWGQPVVISTAMREVNVTVEEAEKQAGFLVDFSGSTKIWERSGVRIDWSEAPEGSVEGEAAFKSNELVFRGEGRYGFGVLKPAGVVRFPVEA